MKLKRSIERLVEGIPLRIVALGDSLTEGWMVSKGYIDFLKEMIEEKYSNCNIEVINRGIPGDTSSEGLYRLRRDVIENGPDLVFIQFALNDAYCGSTPEKFEKNILAIVENIQNYTDAEILLITSIFILNRRENDFVETFYDRLKNISESKGIPLASVHNYWKDKVSGGVDYKDLVQSDQVHPTIEGYRLMAEAIMKKF